jgi:hypothetical protein
MNTAKSSTPRSKETLPVQLHYGATEQSEGAVSIAKLEVKNIHSARIDMPIATPQRKLVPLRGRLSFRKRGWVVNHLIRPGDNDRRSTTRSLISSSPPDCPFVEVLRGANCRFSETIFDENRLDYADRHHLPHRPFVSEGLRETLARENQRVR